MRTDNQIVGPNLAYSYVIAVLFVVLKLSHLTDWNWVWVLGPVWIPWTCLFGLFVLNSIVLIFRSPTTESTSTEKN